MATLCATATARPPYRYDQETIRESLSLWLGSQHPLLPLAQRVFRHAAVQTRYGCRPLLDLVRPLSLTEAQTLYQKQAQALGQEATRKCLKRAGVDPAEVHLMITASCTGLMIPSLDAYLMNRFSFSPHTKRLPLTELGCVAGACALARAYDYLQAFPHENALVVAVELPSLTFQVHDLSPANIVSSALFGDGAAAVLLRGEKASGKPRILASQSTLFPQTTELMGFGLKDTGLHITLSPEIPRWVRSETSALVEGFLARQGLTLNAISHFLFHPGGRRVLEGLEESLGLPRQKTRVSWEILRDSGNLSSAAVLFVLDRFLESEPCQKGDLGLLLAFGPGFSVEMLLLEWE